MLEKLEADLDNENPWERVVTLVRNANFHLHIFSPNGYVLKRGGCFAG